MSCSTQHSNLYLCTYACQHLPIVSCTQKLVSLHIAACLCLRCFGADQCIMVACGDCPGLLAWVSCVDHFRLSAGRLEPYTLRYMQGARSRHSACLMPTTGSPWCPERDESIETVNASPYAFLHIHLRIFIGLCYLMFDTRAQQTC